MTKKKKMMVKYSGTFDGFHIVLTDKWVEIDGTRLSVEQYLVLGGILINRYQKDHDGLENLKIIGSVALSAMNREVIEDE